MDTELIDFHLSCKRDFESILESFNLLFYGYGCKASLLARLFPDAKIRNLRLQSMTEIVDELILDGFHTNKNATIEDIDRRLCRDNESLTLVLLNFNFELFQLQNLKNIKLVGTVENIDFNFDLTDIRSFNFVFRDLTTFVSYTDEVLDINIASNKASTAIMVIKSIPNKSKIIFMELLKLGNCSVNDLYNKLKVSLMMSKKNTIVEALNEFIDHDIIKLREGNQITLKLNKEECKNVLESDIWRDVH